MSAWMNATDAATADRAYELTYTCANRGCRMPILPADDAVVTGLGRAFHRKHAPGAASRLPTRKPRAGTSRAMAENENAPTAAPTETPTTPAVPSTPAAAPKAGKASKGKSSPKAAAPDAAAPAPEKTSKGKKAAKPKAKAAPKGGPRKSKYTSKVVKDILAYRKDHTIAETSEYFKVPKGSIMGMMDGRIHGSDQ